MWSQFDPGRCCRSKALGPGLKPYPCTSTPCMEHEYKEGGAGRRHGDLPVRTTAFNSQVPESNPPGPPGLQGLAHTWTADLAAERALSPATASTGLRPQCPELSVPYFTFSEPGLWKVQSHDQPVPHLAPSLNWDPQERAPTLPSRRAAASPCSSSNSSRRSNTTVLRPTGGEDDLHSGLSGSVQSSTASLFAAPGPPPFWLTTLIVRHLPPRCSQEQLLHVWPQDGSYDFLFLPYSVKQRRAARYAFINCTSAVAAKALFERWNNTWLPGSPEGSMPLQVSEANVQGLCPNLWHHRSIGSDRTQHQPLVWRHGQRVELGALMRGMDQRQLWVQPWQGDLAQLQEQWEQVLRTGPQNG